MTHLRIRQSILLVAALMISACTVSNSEVPGLSGPSEGSGVLVQPKGGSPTADFTLSPTKPVAGQVVFANAAGSLPAPGHTLSQFFWTWGDGASTSGLTSHAFSTQGDYVIQLTVVDNLANTATASKTLTVGNGNPTGSFIFAIGGLVGPLRTVNFDASGSTATGGASIIAYAWTFGDGSSQPPTGTAITSHNYVTGASYPVTLTVTDSSGRTGVFSQNINIP